MSARKRIRNYVPTVQGGGGGGPSPGGTIQWGPTFGEGDGEQAVSAGIDLSALALKGDVGASSALSHDVAVDYNLLGGSSALTGEAEGAPFLVATETVSSGPTSSITINKPAGTSAGELLVMIIGSQSVLVSAHNTPSGWTQIHYPSDVSPLGASCYYKVTGSSEPASYSFTNSGSLSAVTGEIHRFIGVNTSAPINASNFHRTTVGDLDPDPETGGVTTTVANCLVLASVIHDHTTLSQSHTPPASHTEETDFEATTSLLNIHGSSTSWRVFATAGATGDATVNCSQAAGRPAIAFRIAIAPGPVTLA